MSVSPRECRTPPFPPDPAPSDAVAFLNDFELFSRLTLDLESREEEGFSCIDPYDFGDFWSSKCLCICIRGHLNRLVEIQGERE